MKSISAIVLAAALCAVPWLSAQDSSQTANPNTPSAITPSATTPSGQSTGSDKSSAQQGTTGESQVLIDPGKIYNDETPTEWVGKSVELRNVMVQDTNESGNFWVGSGGKQRLLVVKNQEDPNQRALRIRKGDVVNIMGLVQPATEEWAQKTKAEMGSMDDARGGAGVFLNATSVSIASSTAK